MATFKLIASSTVGSGGASTIDFTSIPQTYTDLCFHLSLRTNYANPGSYWVMSFNNNTANRSQRRLYADGGGAGSDTDTTFYGTIDGNGATASTFGSSCIYIPNYTSANNKSWSAESVFENNSSSSFQLNCIAGLWSNTSAINQITFSMLSGYGTGFAQYSTAYLYGISNA